ncbi:MAG TPA: tetratricopeptide repeat protein [bacterium]|nr:tetratricopeptide repeat protein [bacterium]
MNVYEGAAAVLIQRKKDREARRLVDSAIPKYPDSENLRMLRGNLKVFETDYEGAIADYRQLQTKNPDNVQVLNGLARAYFLDKQIDNALQTGKRLLEIDSGSELSVRLRKDLVEGGLWEAEDLQRFLLSHGMRFIVEEMDEYLFLYVDEQAHADHDWIRVTVYESTQEARENAELQDESYLEAGAEDLTENSFFWGRFIFTKGCGLNETCSATWENIRQLLKN